MFYRSPSRGPPHGDPLTGTPSRGPPHGDPLTGTPSRGPPHGDPLTGPRRGVPVRGSLIKLKRPSRVSDPLTGRDMGRRANLQKSDGGRVPRPWRGTRSELGRIWPPSRQGRGRPNPSASLTGWRPSRGQLRRPVRDATLTGPTLRANLPPRRGGGTSEASSLALE